MRLVVLVAPKNLRLGEHSAQFARASLTAFAVDATSDAISAQAHRRMDELLSEARAKGIPIRNARVLPGNAPRAIIEAAKSGDYVLIVIGSRHHRGLKRAVLGSVAERVVRHAPCPVLLATAKTAASGDLAAAVPSELA